MTNIQTKVSINCKYGLAVTITGRQQIVCENSEKRSTGSDLGLVT